MDYIAEIKRILEKLWSIITAIAFLITMYTLIVQLNLSRIEILQVLTLFGVLFLGIITWSGFKTMEILQRETISRLNTQIKTNGATKKESEKLKKLVEQVPLVE